MNDYTAIIVGRVIFELPHELSHLIKFDVSEFVLLQTRSKHRRDLV